MSPQRPVERSILRLLNLVYARQSFAVRLCQRCASTAASVSPSSSTHSSSPALSQNASSKLKQSPLGASKASSPPKPSALPAAPAAVAHARERRKQPDADFSPQILNRGLGVPKPPSPGENDGIDRRSWRQRRDDFFDYDRHLVRRNELTRQMAKPYFRDWTQMRHHQGKVFIGPPTLLRAELALYFPNFRGVTLSNMAEPADSTTIFRGHASVVAVYSGLWAQRQTQTFLNGNTELNQILAKANNVAQRIDINVEDNKLKYGLVRLFAGSLRRQISAQQHDRYLLVHRGVTDELRAHLSIFNARVGYVFLVDSACRIRWAANANAQPQEREALNRGLATLIKEVALSQESQIKRPTSVDKSKRQPGRGK